MARFRSRPIHSRGFKHRHSESEHILTPMEKSALPEKQFSSEEDRTPRRSIKQDSEPKPLPTHQIKLRATQSLWTPSTCEHTVSKAIAALERQYKTCSSNLDVSLACVQVVLASMPDLQSGYSRDLFVAWCSNSKNSIVLTAKTSPRTLARWLIDNQDAKTVTLEVICPSACLVCLCVCPSARLSFCQKISIPSIVCY